MGVCAALRGEEDGREEEEGEHEDDKEAICEQ